MLKLILLQLFLLFSINVWADSFFVNATNGVGITDQENQVITEMIKSTVLLKRHTLSDTQQNANYILKSKALKMGQAIVLTIDKYKGDVPVYTSQLKSDRLEDLDNISRRVTESVIDEKDVKNNTTVTDLNATDEKAGTKRRQAVNRWHVALGAAKQSNLNRDSVLFHLTAGYEWELPLSNAAIRILWEGTDGYSLFGLGGTYFLSSSDISPIIQAVFGYGGARTKGSLIFSSEDKSGFGYSAGVGFRFFRLSSVNLETVVQYSQILKHNREGYPGEATFKIGVYF